MSGEKITFSSAIYQFSFEDYQTLYAQKKIALGLNHNTTEALLTSFPNLFKGSGINAARTFFALLALVIAFGGIVGSFFYAWWVFIPAFVFAYIVGSSARTGNTANVLDALETNKEAYDFISQNGAMIYKMADADLPDAARQKILEAQAEIRASVSE